VKKYILRGAVLGAVTLLTMFHEGLASRGIIMLMVLGLALGAAFGCGLSLVKLANLETEEEVEPEREDVHS
jgi:hypothetical protein